VVGKFVFDTSHELPSAFGMNERGGMNSVELDKCMKKAILPLFPDVEDVPCKHVLLKLDSGLGQMNLDMPADLVLQGVQVIPGIQNTMHVTQETDQNCVLCKRNLQLLLEAMQKMRKRIMASDLPLLVFGGHDHITKTVLKNAFERAFSLERNLGC